MKQVRLVPLMLGAVFIGAMLAAMALKPRERLADTQAPLNLQTAVPKSFGHWSIDTSMAPIGVSPDVQAKLDQLYSQVLSRTYVNAKGERMMLSIAYGGDQSGESLQVHRPEYCYAAQGFQVLSGAVDAIRTRLGTIAVRRVIATKGPRHEAITYWITVGDKAALPGWRRKFLQIGYGLSGRIPDGMLVRISSIGTDSTAAYRAQDEFIDDLVNELEAGDRVRVIGAISE